MKSSSRLILSETLSSKAIFLLYLKLIPTLSARIVFLSEPQGRRCYKDVGYVISFSQEQWSQIKKLHCYRGFLVGFWGLFYLLLTDDVVTCVKH